MLKFIQNYFQPRLWSLVFLLLVFGFFNVSFVSAGGKTVDNTLWNDQANTIQNQTGLGNVDPRIIVARIINIVLGFLGIIAICLIMYAGYLWMTSGGNPDKINQAKRILVGGIIGLIIILSAFAIAAFILKALFEATHGNGNNGGFPPCVGPGCSSDSVWCSSSLSECSPDQATCQTLGDDYFCDIDCYCKRTTTTELTACSSVQGTCQADDQICTDKLGSKWGCNDTTCLCEVTNMSSCFNTAEDICNYPCRNGLSCFGYQNILEQTNRCEDNLPEIGCGLGNDSCYCCCSTTNDKCSNIYSSLKCKRDTTPCTGDDRGMCCGCKNDTECGMPEISGCGDDTCCRERPKVTATIPAGGSDNVCTNALIQVDFNQAMKAETFNDSILIIGEYSGPCPENTKLVNTNDSSIPLTFVAGVNYCSIEGGFGATNFVGGSHVFFTASNFLSVDTKYHIVVRGDENMNDNIAKGILSYWSISMDGLEGGIRRYESSFKTRADTNGTGGICVIDRVDLTPSSWLFNTSLNSAREKDNDATNPTFDIDKDRDKLFASRAMSVDNQVLASMPGYQWDWNMKSSVQSVVNLAMTGIANLFPGSALANAVEGVTDGRSIISSIIDMTNYLPGGSGAVMNITDVGNGVSDRANVYVFICENPWPPVDEKALIMWEPWKPKPYNPFNYDIYYCRDKGKPGTADDLPAFDSMGIMPVQNDGDNILQQSYFTYKVPPAPGNISSIVSATPSLTYPDGGAVSLAWTSVPGAVTYKIYWGELSGSYRNATSVSASQITATIDGLKNDIKYYFSVTALTADKAESSYFKEVTVVPLDRFAPVANPAFAESAIKVDKNEILLSWTSVPEAVSYELSYGLHSGPLYGMQIDMGSDTELIIKDLSQSTMYYFGVRAMDAAGNKSPYGIFSTSTPAN